MVCLLTSVYSKSVEKSEAIKLAYKLGTKDSISHIAVSLREIIKGGLQDLTVLALATLR